MAGQVLGLDFGTTNSLAAMIDPRNDRPRSFTNIEDLRPHPSTVWYRGGTVVVGRAARQHLDSGDDAISGEFVRSPKRLLIGQAPVAVDGSQIDPQKIVAEVLKHVRDDAGSAARGASAVTLDRAVMTIPVNLDGNGRRALREAAKMANIDVVQFVHEPLAALYAWLRSQDDYRRRLAELDGRRVLVFDWGGGTLDLTLCLIRGGKLIQIANDGDNEVGGDYFDDVVRAQVRQRHAEEHGLENVTALENEGASTRLLNQCELAKIALSEHDSYTIVVTNYLRCEMGRLLRVKVTRQDIESWTSKLVGQGLACIDRLLENAGLSCAEIELCLPTGGMVNVPSIRSGLFQRFPARVPKLDNGDRIIAEGAAWIAHDELRLTLAKPIELTDPYGGHIEIVDASLQLPLKDQELVVCKSQFYCTDPRDGVAKFQFARPVKAGYVGASDPRRPYAVLQVKVSPIMPPFAERIDLEIKIDHDYVARVHLESTLQRDRMSKEIHDLEFALALPWGAGGSYTLDERNPAAHTSDGPNSMTSSFANIQIKTNVYHANDWRMVPGDLVSELRSAWLDTRTTDGPSPLQRQEAANYSACAYCKRLLAQIELEGCDCGSAITPDQAAKRLAELRLSW